MQLPERTQQVADVVGEPVDEHGERHGHTGEDVHDREDPQHHLLHAFGLLVHRGGRGVAAHRVPLHVPQARAHGEHEDADDDLAACAGRGERVGDLGAEERGRGELLRGGHVKGAQWRTLAAGDVRMAEST